MFRCGGGGGNSTEFYTGRDTFVSTEDGTNYSYAYASVYINGNTATIHVCGTLSFNSTSTSKFPRVSNAKLSALTGKTITMTSGTLTYPSGSGTDSSLSGYGPAMEKTDYGLTIARIYNTSGSIGSWPTSTLNGKQINVVAIATVK